MGASARRAGDRAASRAGRPTPQAGEVRIGISGWRYPGWRGFFYPQKLAQRRELEFAAGCFSSVEINGTFYSLQRPSSFRQWAASTPANFTFACKGSRYITHMLKLKNVEQPLANFFASGLLELGPKLGPLLWQFPPQVHFGGPSFNSTRFSDFFNLLPRTHGQAASLAKLHDERLKDRACVDSTTADSAPLRHCIEVRDESFAGEEFIALLREHDIGLVVADTVAWPLLFDITSDFIYCRLHGSEELYASGYGPDALDVWADRVAAWAQGRPAEGRRACAVEAECRPRDVYVYFDNDAKVHAPFDAQNLQSKVAERLRERDGEKNG